MSTNDKLQNQLANSLLTLTEREVRLLNAISERIIQKLDKVDKLTDKEENLVQVVVSMAIDELRNRGWS